MILLQDDLVDGLPELPPVVLPQYLDDLGRVAHHIPVGLAGPVLVGLKVLDDDFEEFLDDEVLLLVEALDLWDLFVLLEVLGELIEGGDEVGDHLVLLVLAGVPQFLERVDHHDELLEGVDAEGEVLLGDVEALEVLAHIIDYLLALLGLLLDDADLADDLLRQLLGLLDLLAYLDVHHGVLVDLVDQLLVHLRQLRVQLLDFLVQADQRLLVGELGVEVGDRVEVGLLELLAHLI